MFGSDLLDVAIGLVLVYLCANMACSGIMEVIARVFDLRAKHLKQELIKLLKNGKLVDAIYSNQLIQEIKKNFIVDRQGGEEMGKDPENIPPNNFAHVLVNVLLETKKDTSEFKNFEESIKKIENPQARSLLLQALQSSIEVTGEWEQGLQDAGKSISLWFDTSMEQLSKWYKKKSRKIIIIVGILLTLVLNLDSLAIIKSLYKNQVLRSSVVEIAKQTTSKQKIEDISFEKLKGKLTPLDFPIGWDFSKIGKSEPTLRDKLLYIGPKLFSMQKIIGLLLTMIAITFGANFWFDLLKKLIGFRKETGN